MAHNWLKILWNSELCYNGDNEQAAWSSTLKLRATDYVKNIAGACNPHPHNPSHYPLINTLRLRQNGRHFADNFIKCIFFKENFWILNKISLKYAPQGLIDNMAALVQIMAWRWRGDKPLSEPMMAGLLMHICVTQPQWIKPFLFQLFVVEAHPWNYRYVTYRKTIIKNSQKGESRGTEVIAEIWMPMK